MIKSINIKNYGPFQEESANFESDSLPITIIGMNDVGKTALLNAINSCLGLNKKYGVKKDTEVCIKFKINKEDFSEEILKELDDLNIDAYIGDVSLLISSTEIKMEPSIFTSNDEIKSFFEKLINIINENLSLANHIKLDKITNKNIEEVLEKINGKTTTSKKDKNAEKYMKLLLKVKGSIYHAVYHSTISMSADSRDHFDYIKGVYILKDTTNELGEVIKSDWGEIRKFLNAFFKEKEIEEFDKIIYSDSDESEKRRQLKSYEEKMSDEMNRFFEDHFPSQNSNLKFSFDVQTDNKIYLNVKDDSTEYMSLNNRSDGFKWFLKMFILLKQIKNNNTILIDEPEKFLHAAAQRELVKLFQKIKQENNIQIIYATHSPFMLPKDFFPTIKIISKDSKGSKIYNNINSFINSKNEKINDVMTPIANALGINLFELTKLNNIENFLFVEGEADIYTIRIAEFISKEKFEIDHFIWPMAGEANSYGLYIADLHNFKYKLFLDGKEREVKIKTNENTKVIFLSNLFEKKDIVNPEDMLDDKTKNEYKIDCKNEKGKTIPNHKVGWQKMHDDLIAGKYKLSEREVKYFKVYGKKLRKEIE